MESTDTSNQKHLAYLDGMRGLAALYVVMYHAVVVYGDLVPQRFLTRRFEPFMHGSIGVTVFITLSGFCLMAPVSKTAALTLRGGVSGYLKRRAWRVLPAYYAALASAFVIPLMVSLVFRNTLAPGRVTWIIFTGAKDLALHIALLHNLSSHTAQDILPPLWSVATEFQIYLVFAFLLLPAARRLGMTALMIAAAAASIVPFVLLPANHNCASACPWLLIAFAIGTVAASAIRGSLRSAAAPVIVAAAIIFFPDTAFPNGWSAYWIKQDIEVALLAGATMTMCVRSPGIIIRRILEWKPLVWLGISSYSLYLTHYLVLAAIRVLWLGNSPMRPMLKPTFSLIIGVPLAILFSRGFYRLFERPFMAGEREQRRGRRAPV